MFRGPFPNVVVGPDGLALTSEDCAVSVGSEGPADTSLWLPSADTRGQIVFLVRSAIGRGCVNVLALDDDHLEHWDVFAGFKLDMGGQHALLVANGAGVWHVVNSSNPVWLVRKET